MAIPALLKARLAANESSAISSLRSILIANEAYEIRFASYASTLTNLRTAELLEETVAEAAANPGKSGYLFDYQLTGSFYSINANPLNPGSSGNRHFVLDQTGVIRYREGSPASSADTPVN